MQTAEATLYELVAEIERRHLPKRQQTQLEYLRVRLRFLTPASLDAALGNARILLDECDRESRKAAA